MKKSRLVYLLSGTFILIANKIASDYYFNLHSSPESSNSVQAVEASGFLAFVIGIS